MTEDLGQGTLNTEKTLSEADSPNLKIHGDLPPASPLPGAENPESDTVNKEVNPNTE